MSAVVVSADGTDVIATEEGEGVLILIVHGGMSQETPWAPVAKELARDHRVVRIRRRLYRTELPVDPATDFAREVEDIRALTATFGGPCVIVGHSSGAVVALEALVADPTAFAGAVLYEPPVVLDGPLGTPTTLPLARAALAEGRTGRALKIFLAEAVGVPRYLAVLVGLAAGRVPDLAAYGPRQIDDLEAIDRLGRRIEAYGVIETPTLFLTGDRSPTHLGERTEALLAAMPHATRETMPGVGHDANSKRPALVARLVAEHVQRVGLRA